MEYIKKLTRFEPELFKKLKALAALRGKFQYELLNEIIREYLENNGMSADN